MATYIILRHPVTILVTVLTNSDNLTNDLSILKLTLTLSYCVKHCSKVIFDYAIFQEQQQFK